MILLFFYSFPQSFRGRSRPAALFADAFHSFCAAIAAFVVQTPPHFAGHTTTLSL
jgi:hypothetical protein